MSQNSSNEKFALSEDGKLLAHSHSGVDIYLVELSKMIATLPDGTPSSFSWTSSNPYLLICGMQDGSLITIRFTTVQETIVGTTS
jgi:hypothetical protein